ncbi:MAG: ABC transporter substrate-binding protein [Opitutaceae bacterium]|jgi:iron complex transport system substrate-binding protein|nr:ABC transporter substrate-binding protein [Opitutaceae bacterium]
MKPSKEPCQERGPENPREQREWRPNIIHGARVSKPTLPAFASLTFLSAFILQLSAFSLQPFSPSVFAASPQTRVVSQTVGNDELLLAVAAPGQIAALSHLSRDPEFAADTGRATAFPNLPKNATAETILSFSPTLVLFTDYSRPELVEQVRRAGVRVVIIDRYFSLEDAFANLRLIARELGPEAETRAETVIAGCLRRVAALREKLAGATPVRVIAPSTYGLIPGDQSTFQDLCDHAAAENLAATLGHLHGHQPPPSEKMLTWPVDKVVLVGTNAAAALAPFKKLPPYQYMSAVRESRVALLAPWQISCVSHLRVDAYERLARELHPELFPERTPGNVPESAPGSAGILPADEAKPRPQNPQTSRQDAGAPRDSRAPAAPRAPTAAPR